MAKTVDQLEDPFDFIPERNHKPVEDRIREWKEEYENLYAVAQQDTLIALEDCMRFHLRRTIRP